MLTLIINLHSQRLPVYEEDAVHVGYTLNCGFEWENQDAPPEEGLLWAVKPWTWRLGPWVAATPQQPGNDTLELIVTAEDRLASSRAGFPADAVVEKCADEFDRMCDAVTGSGPSFDPELLRMMPGAGRATLLENDSRKKPLWAAVLGELAARPAPLPHVLNLAGILRFSLEQYGPFGMRPLLLAPTMTFDGGSMADPSNGGLKEFDRDRQVWQLEYPATQDSAFRVVLRQKATVLDAPKAFRPWVTLGSGTAITQDVTRTLEEATSALFDFAGHVEAVIESLGTTVERRRVERKEDWDRILDDLLETYMVCLRDRANDGACEGPGGGTLAVHLIRALEEPDRTRLEAKHQSTGIAGSLEEWVVRGLRGRQHSFREKGALESWLEELLSSTDSKSSPGLPGKPDWSPDKEERDASLSALSSSLRLFRGRLQEEETLRRNLIAGWTRVFAFDQPPFDESFRRAFENAVAKFRLSAWTPLGDVGAAWEVLATGHHTELWSLATLAYGSEEAARRRLVRQGGKGLCRPPYDSHVPPRVELREDVFMLLVGRVSNAAHATHSALMDGLQGSTSVAEGLTVEVRPPRFVPRGEGLPEEDEGVAGYGMLLRRSDPGAEWRLPALAHLEVGGKELFRSAVVPEKLYVRSALLQGLLTYDDGPATAQRQRLFLHHGARPPAGEKDPPITSPVAYRSPFGAADELLPPLVDGRTYDVAVFRVALSGALPPEVAASDSATGEIIPWKLREPTDRKRALELTEFKQASYFRSVQVGSVSLFGGAPGPGESSCRPAVFPLPRGIEPLAGRLLAGSAPESLEDQRSIAVLCPGEEGELWRGDVVSAFEFLVQPPRTDVWTWTRYARNRRDGQPIATRAQREAVLAEVLRASDESSSANGDPTQGERVPLPDDPAVSAIEFQLRDGRPGPHPVLSTLSYDLPVRVDGAEKVAEFNRKPIACRVEVKAGEITSAALTRTNAGGVLLSLTVPPALTENGPRRIELFRLSIRPVVPANERSWFLQTLRNRLETPVDVYVEVPAPPPLDSSSLHTALSLKWEEPGEKLRCELNASGWPPAARESFTRYETGIQNWRWDGRPLEHEGEEGWKPGFRFDMDLGSPQSRADEALLFAGRDPSDMSIVERHGDAVSGGTVPLHTLDLSSRPGAQYVRACVRAYSRYESILRARSSVQSLEAGDGPGPSRWKRHIVPCRYRGEVPVPALKVLVPLTRTIPGGGGLAHAGLLAVLDEGFFDPLMAGLAEGLEAQVVGWGPDVVFHPLDDAGPGGTLALSIRGPFGFTFDSDTLAPEFRRAGCVFEVQDEEISRWEDPFLWLRIRRTIEMPGGVVRVSTWTPPAVVQLQRPANRWLVRDEADEEARWVDVSSLGCSAEKGLEFRAAGKKVEVQARGIAASGRVSLWYLLLRASANLFRSRGELAISDFVPADPTPSVPPEAAAIRLVEVQTVDGVSPSKTYEQLQKKMFPDLTDSAVGWGPEAHARVIRISDPIPISR